MSKILLHDWRGSVVYESDLVVYSVRHGSVMNLVEAQALKNELLPVYEGSSTLIPTLTVKPTRDKYGPRSGKTVRLTNLRQVTKV